MNFICVFAYCILTIEPSPKCESYVGLVTSESTDKMIDTVIANGRSYSFCGYPAEVKNSPLFLAVIKR